MEENKKITKSLYPLFIKDMSELVLNTLRETIKNKLIIHDGVSTRIARVILYKGNNKEEIDIIAKIVFKYDSDKQVFYIKNMIAKNTFLDDYIDNINPFLLISKKEKFIFRTMIREENSSSRTIVINKLSSAFFINDNGDYILLSNKERNDKGKEKGNSKAKGTYFNSNVIKDINFLLHEAIEEEVKATTQELIEEEVNEFNDDIDFGTNQDDEKGVL